MSNFRYGTLAGAVALVLLAGCSPEDYPTEPRYEVIPDTEEPGHLFLYNVRADQPVTSITIPGTLVEPNWTPEESPALDNVWQVTLDLSAGTHEYKYVFNGTDGWAGNMCDEGTWGHPDYEMSVDPDNAGSCNGENAQIEIEEAGPHTFRYIVPEGVTITELYLAGSFQEWTPANSPMHETFQVWLPLDPGTYQYKFHFNGSDWAGNMCNDTNWGDPDNDYKVDINVQSCDGENGSLTID
ncbi:MAG: hypothetical protein P8177_06045 [Gemmatimonadota bacterium]|jgi:hypothetical protein